MEIQIGGEVASAREILIAIANDFQNDYLTVAYYASANHLTLKQATDLIALAQAVRRSTHPEA